MKPREKMADEYTILRTNNNNSYNLFNYSLNENKQNEN